MHTCVLKEKWGQYRIPIIIDDFFTTAKKKTLHMTVCMGKRAFCDMAVFYK